MIVEQGLMSTEVIFNDNKTEHNRFYAPDICPNGFSSITMKIGIE